MNFSQKDNVQQYRGGAPHIEMSFPRYPASCDYIEYQECGLPEETRNYAGLKTCVQFGVSYISVTLWSPQRAHVAVLRSPYFQPRKIIQIMPAGDLFTCLSSMGV